MSKGMNLKEFREALSSEATIENDRLKNELENLKDSFYLKIKELEENTPYGKHIITGDVRKLSSKLFSQIEDKSIENVFILCEEQNVKLKSIQNA